MHEESGYAAVNLITEKKFTVFYRGNLGTSSMEIFCSSGHLVCKMAHHGWDFRCYSREWISVLLLCSSWTKKLGFLGSIKDFRG